jgi:predicted nucleic acid-binding protein
MKVYFDVCCLCRPFDDLSQARMKGEAAAVLALMKHAIGAGWTVAGSELIDIELQNIQDGEKLRNVREFCKGAGEHLKITDEVRSLSQEFQSRNVKPYDSIHLALAAINAYDVLLTTDDNFLKAAKKMPLQVQVENPAVWFMEAVYET